MADLKSDKQEVSILAMASEDLMEHIQTVRSRRREKLKPQPRATKKAKEIPNKELLKLASVEDLNRLVKEAKDAGNLSGNEEHPVVEDRPDEQGKKEVHEPGPAS